MSCGTFEASQARVQRGGIYTDAAAVFIFSSMPPPAKRRKRKKKSETRPADAGADSDHIANEYLSYLDIRLKRLNQGALCGPRALLIENTGGAR